MYVTVQDSPSLATLANPVQSIVFTTSLLPVSSSLTAIPQIIGVPQGIINGINNNFTLMLTDFQVQDGHYTPSVNYTPTAEYRLIDLFGNNPISSVDLQVYWTDVFGGMHPLLLDAQCSCTIKLLFRRKQFNLTNWV
jgi:hypothetical protein